MIYGTWDCAANLCLQVATESCFTDGNLIALHSSPSGALDSHVLAVHTYAHYNKINYIKVVIAIKTVTIYIMSRFIRLILACQQSNWSPPMSASSSKSSSTSLHQIHARTCSSTDQSGLVGKKTRLFWHRWTWKVVSLGYLLTTSSGTKLCSRTSGKLLSLSSPFP